MQIIKDEYIKIELWCRPLAKERYLFSEIKKGKVKNVGKGTGTLFAAMAQAQEKARHESDILKAKQEAGLLSLTPEQLEIAEARARLEEPVEDLSSMPRFKRLKARVDNALFDYSEIKREQIAEEINKLVNKDGYYNEVEPVDADQDFKESVKISPAIVAIIVGIVGIVIYLIWTVTTMFG